MEGYYKCVVCDETFKSKSRTGIAKFCSYKCKYKNSRKKFLEKHPEELWIRERKNCIICNDAFTPNVKNQICCSKRCRKVNNDKKLKNTQFHKARFEILLRDEFTCRYCGSSPRLNKNVKLHIDHIEPKIIGRNNNSENLITACEYCNLGKGQKFYPEIFKLDFPTKNKKVKIKFSDKDYNR